jgi:hypothetical protein
MAIVTFETLLQLELMGMREPKITDKKYRNPRNSLHPYNMAWWQHDLLEWERCESARRQDQQRRDDARQQEQQNAAAAKAQQQRQKAADHAKWQAQKDAALAKQQQKYAARVAERAEWQAGKDAALAREAANKAKKAEYVRGRDVLSKMEPEGQTSTYFGGIGKPDGPKHGHIVTDADGNITYNREPKK